MSDDEGEETVTTRSHAEYVKRRKTFQDWVTTVGGLVAILATIAAGILWLMGVLPFVRTDVYANDRAADRADVFVLQASSRVQAADIADMKHNGALTLQLQLKARIDSLMNSAIQAQKAGQSTYAIQNEVNALQQQLDEVTRQLNLR